MIDIVQAETPEQIDHVRLDTSVGQAEAIGERRLQADRALLPVARRHQKLAGIHGAQSLRRPEGIAA
jgi:hypothetical protein